MIEDKLTVSQRIRLESLALTLQNSAPGITPESAILTASEFETYILKGDKNGA